MKAIEVDVCLVVSSPSLMLAELVDVIGVNGAEGSHDRGAPHILKGRGKWSTTVWQFCSTLSKSASIEEHLAALYAQLPPERVRASALPSDTRRYLSIGVFSDAQIPTTMLSEKALKIAAEYGAPIELRWYASSELG